MRTDADTPAPPTPTPEFPESQSNQLYSLHAMLLALVAVALVPVLGLSLWAHLVERDHERDKAVERAAHTAGMIAGDLAQETRMASVLLDIMAASPQVRTCEPSECARVFVGFARLAGEYQNLFLLNPEGRVLVSARPVAPSLSLAEDAAFLNALRGQSFAVGVSHGGGAEGEASVTYAAPVHDKRGALRLVLAAHMPISTVSRGFRAAGLPSGTTLVLAGPNAQVLYHIPESPSYAGATLPEEHARLIRQKVAEASGWARGLDGVERFYVLRRLGISDNEVCYVRVGIPKSAVYAESTDKLGRHLAALVISTLLVLLLTRLWAGRYILHPVERLMHAVRALGAGNFNARTGLGPREPGGAGELGELARTFDRMAEGLEQAQTEQEAARKALFDSEERLRAVFNASSDGLLLLVPDGRVLSMNESAARRRNATAPELVGRNILDLIPEYVRNGRRERFEEVVRLRAPLRFEEEREGRTYAIRLYPILDEDGQVRQIASFSRDITERRLSEQALLSAKAAAEAASEAKDAFLTNMSHELRTPLNGLSGMLQLMHEGELSAEQREYLGYARQTARVLMDLINDILDYAALGSGLMVFEHKPFTLAMVCDPLEVELRCVAEAKGLALCFAGQPGVMDQPLLGDPARVSLALRHLLENALKFTDQGGVALDVGISCRDEGDCTLRIQVADTGIGIGSEQMERIFEPFVQADDPMTKRFQGTGLGLSIVRELAARMGGSVEVKSAPDVGSTFILCLSFQTAPPATGA